MSVLIDDMRKNGATDADLAKPVTWADFLRYIGLLKDAHKAMKERVAELERDQLKFAGVWQSSASYKRGDLATHAGSLWHCNGATSERPGDGSGWQLCVKRGDAQ